jgi:hypothetical protein
VLALRCATEPVSKAIGLSECVWLKTFPTSRSLKRCEDFKSFFRHTCFGGLTDLYLPGSRSVSDQPKMSSDCFSPFPERIVTPALVELLISEFFGH